MKKASICLATTIIAVMMVLSLSACYISNPGKMSEVIGTYELSTYRIGVPKTEEELSQKEADDEKNFNYTDKIEEKQITCYLVVKDDGTGYYVYKDKDTPLYAKEVKIFYSYEDENKEKVKEIRYTVGIPHSDDDYPGCGEELLGVNIKNKTLNFHLGMYNSGVKWIKSRNYDQRVSYKKVSDKTDLSYVVGKVGNITASPFLLNGLNGAFTAGITYSNEGSDYIYYGINIRATEGKADLYYALKSDKEKIVINDLNVSYVVKETNDDYNGKIAITIGDDDLYYATYAKAQETYSYNDTYVPIYLSWERNGVDEDNNPITLESRSFNKLQSDKTMEDYITESMAGYEEYLKTI